jgi:hypothetical protein
VDEQVEEVIQSTFRNLGQAFVVPFDELRKREQNLADKTKNFFGVRSCSSGTRFIKTDVGNCDQQALDGF